MLKITPLEDGFTIKQNSELLYLIMVFLGAMLFRVGRHWLDMLRGSGPKDYVGLLFLSLWLLILDCILTFVVIRKLITRAEITNRGITYFCGFRKKEILWCELKDYGISFDGRGRNGNTYTLYFSDEILPEKSPNKKKLKRVRIQFDMLQVDYGSVYATLLPYCGRHTGLKPFLPVSVP